MAKAALSTNKTVNQLLIYFFGLLNVIPSVMCDPVSCSGAVGGSGLHSGLMNFGSSVSTALRCGARHVLRVTTHFVFA